MDIGDESIAHLIYLGPSFKEVAPVLVEKAVSDASFLELAEVADSISHRDGGLLNRKIVYVAGVCGDSKSISPYDLRDNVESLVYFDGGGAMVQRCGVWRYCGDGIRSCTLADLVDYNLVEIKRPF